jgi:pimeloyl-ACP methyl ester carboxylesterase
MKRAGQILAVLTSFLSLAMVSGAVYQWKATRRDLAATPPPGRLVDVGGHRLHIWCMGSGTPTVILDSGLGGSSFHWALVQPHVAKFTRACSYDRAGMGYSDPGRTPRTSSKIAEELRELIRRSGIEGRVILVGASFGGYNTRVFASVYSDQVGGLVLVDASHENQGEHYAAAGLPSDIPRFASLVPLAASLGILRLMGITLGAPVEAAPVEVRQFVSATAFRTSRYHTMYDELMSVRESGAQVTATRRKLTIPLIVLSDGRSTGVRADVDRELQRDQATLSTRSCQVIAERSGHLIARDQPEVVVDAIRTVVEAAGDFSGKPLC